MTEKRIICPREVQFVDRKCLLQACSRSKHRNSVFTLYFSWQLSTNNFCQLFHVQSRTSVKLNPLCLGLFPLWYRAPTSCICHAALVFALKVHCFHPVQLTEKLTLMHISSTCDCHSCFQLLCLCNFLSVITELGQGQKGLFLLLKVGSSPRQVTSGELKHI